VKGETTVLKQKILVIGGCRSGKSSHAMMLAEKMAERNRVYVATCVPLDDEMKDRVQKHQDVRDATWKTVETPLDLPQAIEKLHGQADVILVDCLTLWVTKMLMADMTQSDIFKMTEELIAAITTVRCPVILVSNEVGTGIVPENKLARLFRDMAGFVNQKMAKASDQVVWMVAGIPVTIKPSPGDS